MSWEEWAALGTVAAALLALVGVGVSYGIHQQKVTGLTERVEKIDGKDGRLEKLEEAVSATEETRRGVDRLEGEVRSFKENAGLSHQLVLQEVKHLGELWTVKFDELRAQLRRPASRTRQG